MADDTFRDAVAGLESGPASPEAEEPYAGESAAADSHPTVAALRSRFGDAVLHHAVMAGDEHVVRIGLDRVVEVLTWLKEDPGQRYDLLADLTAIDWGGGRPLELVYQLWSIPHRRALRIKASVPVSDAVADSVAGLWKTANWLEREVWDLFGIRFRSHPDLRRILMPEGYAEVHPLRKDFPLRGRFSRAEQTRRALSIPAEEHYSERELAVVDEQRESRGRHERGERTG
jgi:NADH-quinone oxidoreductase subunit C